MVNIVSLELNEASNSINLQATTEGGSQITELLFWDKDTYGDETLAIDLSTLLSGASASENIDIPASAVNLTNFSGVFYFKLTSNEDPQVNTPIGVVANLNVYYECLLNRALNLKVEGVNEKPTFFKFTAQTDTSFVCENLKNEFPKKIQYYLDNQHLKAIVSSEDFRIDFVFKKQN